MLLNGSNFPTQEEEQYADGGKIATKPYVSSGAYINKMSNYCKDCCYNVKEKQLTMLALLMRCIGIS